MKARKRDALNQPLVHVIAVFSSSDMYGGFPVAALPPA
jgi:hypothetical protein